MVWSYEGEGEQAFYGESRGEQERLPNGNILVSDDGTATPFFIVLGVLHLLLTIATRFVSEERPRRPRQAS